MSLRPVAMDFSPNMEACCHLWIWWWWLKNCGKSKVVLHSCRWSLATFQKLHIGHCARCALQSWTKAIVWSQTKVSELISKIKALFVIHPKPRPCQWKNRCESRQHLFEPQYLVCCRGLGSGRFWTSNSSSQSLFSKHQLGSSGDNRRLSSSETTLRFPEPTMTYFSRQLHVQFWRDQMFGSSCNGKRTKLCPVVCGYDQCHLHSWKLRQWFWERPFFSNVAQSVWLQAVSREKTWTSKFLSSCEVYTCSWVPVRICGIILGYNAPAWKVGQNKTPDCRVQRNLVAPCPSRKRNLCNESQTRQQLSVLAYRFPLEWFLSAPWVSASRTWLSFQEKPRNLALWGKKVEQHPDVQIPDGVISGLQIYKR